jgi:biotin synthase
MSLRATALRNVLPTATAARGRGALGLWQHAQAPMSTVVEAQSFPTPASPFPLPPAPQHAGPLPEPVRDDERQRRVKQILHTAVAAATLRHDWRREEIAAIYYHPLMELAYQAVSFRSFTFI